MRKTLIVMSIVLASGSLAACKMFWEKDDKPAATAEANPPATPDPTATAEAGKPDPTAPTATSTPAATAMAGEKTEAPVPAKK